MPPPHEYTGRAQCPESGADFGKADFRNLLLIVVGFVGVLPGDPAYPHLSHERRLDLLAVCERTDTVSLQATRLDPADRYRSPGLGRYLRRAIWQYFHCSNYRQYVHEPGLPCHVLSAAPAIAGGLRSGLLGVVLLGLNPVYVYISYSFMTDVTFLFYILAACLLFIRGLKGHGEAYLWLGGVATALAYLTRQYGILVLLAALAYLWLSHTWTWRRAALMFALPALAVVGYAVWEHFQPQTLITLQINQVQQDMFSNLPGYFDSRMLRVAWLAQSLGLCLAPLTIFPPPHHMGNPSICCHRLLSVPEPSYRRKPLPRKRQCRR